MAQGRTNEISGDREGEIRAVLEKWNRAILDKDVATARQLRLSEYSATRPDGAVVGNEEDLAEMASPELTIDRIQLTALEVHGDDHEATAVSSYLVEGNWGGQARHARCDQRITFVRQDGAWRARRSHLLSMTPVAPPRSWFRGRLGPDRLVSWIRGMAGSPVATPVRSFQELVYRPYMPGCDYVMPRQSSSVAPDEDLPIPPPHLRLLHDHVKYGRLHVAQMREIVQASGFSFEKHGRILDFGCGAGRMIRHFRDLSEACEIWGTDISAEHIYWCKQHLSPPFHFATTTKVPHLPFEDRSFQFIYCGSVFTHIDDLADAWLLELKRILAPGGRLYLTIHDDHTVALFESGRYDSADIVRHMKSAAIYQQAKHSFGMFTIGRDNASQVFYDLDYFSKSLRSMFEIVSITREAYFYQTAILLTRKSP